MGQAPADGPPGAYGPIRDPLGHRGKHPTGHIRHTPVLNVCMRGAGTENERAIVFVDPVELGNARDVDQQVRLDQSEVEHRR